MKRIILIAGPSGAGKTTISHYLQRHFGIPRVVTHTTRPRRPGEVPGQSYYFETDASFARLHFFEHVRYGHYQYGSSREALAKAWQQSNLVCLIVDIQGASSYLQKLARQVYFLYVTVSSKKLLRQRLLKRGATEKIARERLSGPEMNPLPPALRPVAHVLLNDSWPQTKQELGRIVAALK